MEGTPAIILVRPQMGENIGAAARAMMNFGLRDLRLVAPRDGWPNPKAHEMAAHADGIIEQARVFGTLGEAVADRQFVLASSARPRTLPMPVHTPEEGAAMLRQREGRGENTALVFGPERSGLENEDLSHCHGVITIPTDPGNASLNIAQSVVLLGYQWFSLERQADMRAEEPVASLAAFEGLQAHLAKALERRDYFHVEDKKTGMLRNLRVMLQKTGWNEQEVRTLRGMIRALDEEVPTEK